MYYSGRLTLNGVDGNGWTASITDGSDGVTDVIGTLFQPDYAGYQGYGQVQTINMVGFQEYFVSTACAGQPVSGIGAIGPFLTSNTNSTQYSPAQAQVAYHGACPYDDVTACIPGNSCGAPHVYMLAGGTTARTTAAGTCGLALRPRRRPRPHPPWSHKPPPSRSPPSPRWGRSRRLAAW